MGCIRPGVDALDDLEECSDRAPEISQGNEVLRAHVAACSSESYEVVGPILRRRMVRTSTQFGMGQK